MADLSAALQAVASDPKASDGAKAEAEALAAAIAGGDLSKAGAPSPALLAAVEQAGGSKARADLATALASGQAPAAAPQTGPAAPAPDPGFGALASAPAPVASPMGLTDAMGQPTGADVASRPDVGGGLDAAMAPPAAPAGGTPAPAPEPMAAPTEPAAVEPPAPEPAVEAPAEAAPAEEAPAEEEAPSAEAAPEPEPDADKEEAGTSMDQLLAALMADDPEAAAAGAKRVVAQTVDATRGPKMVEKLLEDPSLKAPTDLQLTPEEKQSYESDKAELLRTAMDARERLDWAEVAELVGNAIVKMGAAMAGLRRGVDLSNVQVTKADWERKRDRIMQDYKTALDIRMEAHKERLAELKENRGRADRIDQERRELQRLGTSMQREDERFNASQRQAAEGTNASLAATEAGRREGRKQTAILAIMAEQGKNARAKLAAEDKKIKAAEKEAEKGDAAARQAVEVRRRAYEAKLKAQGEGKKALEIYLSSDVKKADQEKAKGEAINAFTKAGYSAEEINEILKAAKDSKGVFWDNEKKKTEARDKASAVGAKKRGLPTTYILKTGQPIKVYPDEADEVLSKFPSARPKI